MITSGIARIVSSFQRAPPVDVEGLCTALGVGLHYAYLDEDISGELVRSSDDKYIINVNASHPITRQRFTIAHELGHYIFHRNLIGEGIDDDRAYRSTSAGRYHNTNIGPRQETEANQFAANLLMPKSLIDKYTKGGVNDADVPELARTFGVSQQSLTIRLGL